MPNSHRETFFKGPAWLYAVSAAVFLVHLTFVASRLVDAWNLKNKVNCGEI